MPVASLLALRSTAGCTLGRDGRIYAIGGQIGSTTLNTVEAYGPRLTASPAVISAGALLTITGDNFAPSATVVFTFGAASSTPVATGITNAAGVIVGPLSFAVPAVASGSYEVHAVDNRSRYPVRAYVTVP